MNRSLRIGATFAGLFLALVATGCRSTAVDPKRAAAEADLAPRPYDPKLLAPDAPESIGMFLAELDKSIRAWTRLTLTATSNEDKTKASKLQLDLMRRAQPRQKELIAEVESGPPRNRSIAASALGFTRGEQVLSPLLAALHDADQDVVHNALLALALVQMPATPLEPLADVLATHADAHTRANAAYAIRTVLEAGGTAGPAVVNTVRLALADSEPLVQVQAALSLGLVHDVESIEPLSNLLHESMPLVSLSASQALVLIGASNEQVKGKVARVLALAYEQGKGRERDIALRGLVALSGQNLGEESKAWTDWAKRLP